MAKVAVIVGAATKYDEGPGAAAQPATSRWGLGGALSLKFAAAGFHVVLLGRRPAVLEAVAGEVRAQGGAATVSACDVGDDASVRAAFDAAKAVGDVEVVVFNAAAGMPPGRSYSSLPVPHEVDPEYLAAAFNVGVTGCLRCVREAVPGMLTRGRGTILLTGATMSLRGGAKFGALSPVKFALRSFGQSMYQEYAPKGIHVAHVLIDGVIASPGTMSWGESMMLQDPGDIADAYVALHQQKPCVWSYEIQLSPNKESVGMRL